MHVPRFTRIRRLRMLRGAAALLVGTLLALLAGELCVRWLLFSGSELAGRLGAHIRDASALADPNTDEYWKLQWTVGHPRLLPAPHPDAEIGWLGAAEPGSYAHPDEASLAGRRPVLLFGDSYAQCNTEAGECFQALLEESELGRDHALLNYGVGGYGLDQICLLVRRVLPRFAARKPIVVIGVLLDDDFNRSLLSVRGWPKSRARLEAGQLVIDPPVCTDPQQFLRERPVQGRSFLARLLLHHSAFLPSSWRDPGATTAERSAVNRALLDTLAAELDAAGIEHFFLFFNGEDTLFDLPHARWQVDLAREFERETHQPCVWTTPFLRAGACGDAQRAHLFFGGGGRLAGHYNAWGNRVAAEALYQGIRHEFGAPELSRIESWCASGELADLSRTTRLVEFLGCRAQLSVHTPQACIRFHRETGDVPRSELWLRAGAQGETALDCELGSKHTRLRARLERAVGGPSTCIEGALRVSIEVDGEQRLGWTSPDAPERGAIQAAEPASERLDLDLTRATSLRITVRLAGASENCGWVVLRDLVLE